MPPSLADDVRETAEDAYGALPNFFAELNRHSAASGAAYIAADEALQDGLLTPAEQQAVLLVVAAHHNSRYDAVAHARLALDAGLPPQTVNRLLDGDPPADDRLRALVEATQHTYDERGWLDPEFVEDLEARGVSRGELYEIFALYGMKTFSSFVNHIADPAVDDALRPTEDVLDTVPDEPDDASMRRLVIG